MFGGRGKKKDPKDIEISKPIEGSFRRGVHISEADDCPGALVVRKYQILKKIKRNNSKNKTRVYQKCGKKW